MFCAGFLFIAVLVCFLSPGRRLGLQHSFKLVRHNEAAIYSDILLLDGVYENSRLPALPVTLYLYQADVTKEKIARCGQQL
jgi:predicted GNAT superfamily acetyltransferase